MPPDAMTPQRFGELRAQFHALMELDPELRASHLAALGAEDAELRGALERLLANLDAGDLDPPPDVTPTIRRVGAFQLLRRIGRGGMGEVFLAERVEGGFEQNVALKLVRHGALDPELARRFVRERQLLARLDHPNIARLIDGGLTPEGQPWLAMEFVDGCSLARHVERIGPDLRGRVALVRRICAAVAFAHGHLIVHRDIKPANILVGANGEPKLLDFGIAKLLDDDGGGEHTRTAWRAMTTRFAAPEQIAGERTTTATDVYALGLLLFELVAGATPYARVETGTEDWAAAILREPPRSLLQACRVDYVQRERRRLGGALERIVHKALAKSPAQRYASAAALADDLDDWLSGRAPRSGVSGAREQTRQLIMRYRWPLMVLLATLVALGGGALAALRQARIAAEQARVAHAHRDAMLGVLGAANPQHYAGRDPHASEFLRTAAETLQRENADDPALLQRALSEIGHGLINLGKPQEAEAVLQAAVVQLERDVEASASGKLGTYKLLAAVQDEPRHRTALRQTAARIEQLAGEAPPAVALDALGSVAGALSRLGEFDRADALFARGDALLRHVDDNRPDAVENYLRQRGWSAYRAFDLERARDSLQQALRRIGTAPAAFSPMRRAEGQLLLAEVLLAQSEASAHEHLAAAQPVYYAEYPVGHVERAAFDLQQSRLLLLRDDIDGARALVVPAVAVLDAQPNGGSAPLGHGLLAEIAARSGDCARAWAELDLAERGIAALRSAVPRDHALYEAAAGRIQPACVRP
ncbi:MAG: hypothetical protein AMXMBFR59_14540 [Rhodanobacteraceae bacterium]